MTVFSLLKRPPTRLALVIGNSAYQRVGELPNAERDATLIAERLRSIDIEVALHTNLNKESMEGAFNGFLSRLEEIGNVDTVIFYYSGHGYQDGATNYLLPVTDDRGSFEAVPLQGMMETLSGLSRRRLIFLDACRNNLDTDLVEDDLIRSRGLSADNRPLIKSGLSDFAVGEETFISFSAAPGKPAFDGVNARPNSPYVEALSRFIEEVDLPLTVMMARVRNSVLHDTDGRQETWDSSSLKNSYFFNPSSLLFLLGNTLALIASFVALAVLGFVLYEVAVADYLKGADRWAWFHISLAIYALTVAIFLYGVGRAYGRVRGEQSEWQIEGGFRLFRWSSAGSFGAIGGVLGGIISSAIVTLPYWQDWLNTKSDSRLAQLQCDLWPWANPSLPDLCPKLGQLLTEGSVAGIYILTLLGFFTMHFSEWMIRGRPSQRLSADKKYLIIGGAMLGGGLAGIPVGPVITAYFGSQDRPFLEPSLIVFWSILAVAIMSFCVVNYSLESFSLRRLMRSFAGSVVGTICALLFLSMKLAILYSSGFIDNTFSWANYGFHHSHSSEIGKYSYLLIAGLPYGVVFGLSFGVLIGITRLFSEPPAKNADAPDGL